MKKLYALGMPVVLLAGCGLWPRARSDDPSFNYLVGRGSADITGPAVGVQMFGFVRADQITEGIHFRLRARTFIVVDRAGGKRIALCTADLGSITHELHREVVEQIQARLGDETYTIENVILSATHTHCGPGGYWHYGANTPVGSPFYEEHFDAIADGVARSILQAHEDLQPGKILIHRGMVENAGANRSRAAYLLNPEAERARYATDTDQEMTLLKFIDATGEIGILNWFAVHPTSMTFFNKLISGDHKGYAALTLERSRGVDYSKPNQFVAAFAQTNCGDVTPNLNLDNTGPTDDQFENTRIIGRRQFDRAIELAAHATEQLEGGLDCRFDYVDFSNLTIRDEFTKAGPRRTAPSALGYSFAAGSFEDGGGHPLFQEGMTLQNPVIDNIISGIGGIPRPSDALRKAHAPKAILIPTGEMNPPGQPQIIPLSVVKIGQLVLLVGPSEYTTMSGRRIRGRVAEVFGGAVKYLVVAGYSNSFIGYTTTPEEYQSQQYEGGHTIFGPWSLPGYVQEFTRLAVAMRDGVPVQRTISPEDPRGGVQSTPLGSSHDDPPPGARFGDVVMQPKESYRRGERAEAVFWTGHPRNYFETEGNYLAIEAKKGDRWEAIAGDADWATRCSWRQLNAPPPPPPYLAAGPTPEASRPTFDNKREMLTEASQVTIAWDIPDDAPAGIYRIAHHGAYKDRPSGEIKRFSAASREFRVE
jgi:neutral ceramidase